MKPLVSILVPVYNVEEYLEECLNSLINQSFSDIEIIIVNDGSTDKSRLIAEKYCKKDKRIKLVNQDNRGLGAARNVALSHAQGKYVVFVDSDDYIDYKTIGVLYNKAELDKVDLVIYNGKAFYDYDGKIVFEKNNYFRLSDIDDQLVFNGLQLVEHTSGMIKQACFKLYDRAFLIENELLFPEGVLGEDIEFFYKCMIKAEKISYVHFIGYFRRFRKNSILTSGSITNIKDRINHFSDLINLLSLIKQQKYKDVVTRQLVLYAFGLWMLSMGRKQKSEREILLKDFYKQKLYEFLSQNKKGLVQSLFFAFISLPRFFNWFKFAVCRMLMTLFKSKSRLFQ